MSPDLTASMIGRTFMLANSTSLPISRSNGPLATTSATEDSECQSMRLRGACTKVVVAAVVVVVAVEVAVVVTVAVTVAVVAGVVA